MSSEMITCGGRSFEGMAKAWARAKDAELLKSVIKIGGIELSIAEAKTFYERFGQAQYDETHEIIKASTPLGYLYIDRHGPKWSKDAWWENDI